MNRIRNRLDLNAAWVSISALIDDPIRSTVPAADDEHASAREISQLLYLAPSTVRVSALAPAEPIEPEFPFSAPDGPVHTSYTLDEVSANGVLGDPRSASAAQGERLITAALDRICTFIDAFTDGA